jgi:hypothetical protein
MEQNLKFVQLRLSSVRDVFVLSASDNLIAPSLPMSQPLLSENEMKQKGLLLSMESVARDEFDWSASDNLIAPSSPMLLPALSENHTKQQICYRKDRER